MWLIQVESWERESLPDHLVVVGGGVIGCEFACMHASVGVPVTVLEAMPEICPDLDAEVSSSLREGLTKELPSTWVQKLNQ